MRILDHGYVTHVESWGSDQRIIESARMSTDKGFLGWGPDADGKPGDEKLLRYLYENKHSTPFEFAGMTVEIQAPLMVFREWHRHRTQSYSEMSARYVEIPELFYVPSIERMNGGGQSTSNKQASGAALDPIVAEQALVHIRVQCEEAFKTYRLMIADGVAKELARLVLPVGMYSRMRATTDLRNWLGFLTLRMAPGAQWEIRQYADAVGVLVAQHFPRTWELFAASMGIA